MIFKDKTPCLKSQPRKKILSNHQNGTEGKKTMNHKGHEGTQRKAIAIGFLREPLCPLWFMFLSPTAELNNPSSIAL